MEMPAIIVQNRDRLSVSRAKQARRNKKEQKESYLKLDPCRITLESESQQKTANKAPVSLIKF